MKAETLIVNASIVRPHCIEQNRWIAIVSDRIAASGTMDQDMPPAGSITDAHDGLIFPGLIDSHVHFREPGAEHKGNIATESRAAIAGGITSFIDMPNTNPPTLTSDTLADKYLRAAARSAANYGFFLAASDSTPQIIGGIPRHRLPGIKLFYGTTTGAVAAPSPKTIEEIFRICADMRLPVMVHAEDDSIIASQAKKAVMKYGSREAVPVSEHHIIRSREACLRATARIVNLAMRFGTRLHIAHVSTADEIREFLSPGPIESKTITAETTPLYLDPFISDPQARTWRHKVNPAVKTEEDAQALRQALADTRIDTIATDHAPHLRQEKQGGALSAASGAPSAQFALTVLMEYLRPETIVTAMAKNPARLFGIGGRGTLEPGAYADIVLISPTPEHIISDADVITPAGWTPFDGRTVHNSVTSVWINGRHVYGSSGSTTQHSAPQELTFS